MESKEQLLKRLKPRRKRFTPSQNRAQPTKASKPKSNESKTEK